MKSAFLLSKGLLCLYDKQNNTWLLVDMEFLFSCSTQHPTRTLCSLVSYRVKHSKRNSISTRAHVLFSICLVIPLTDAVPQLQNYPLWTSRGLVAFSCCTFLIKTLLSVIFEKRVKSNTLLRQFKHAQWDKYLNVWGKWLENSWWKAPWISDPKILSYVTCLAATTLALANYKHQKKCKDILSWLCFLNLGSWHHTCVLCEITARKTVWKIIWSI